MTFQKGHVMSEEVRKKISETLKGCKGTWLGKKMSTVTRDKMRKSHLGKKLSGEAKRKLSEGKKGDKNPMFGKRGPLSPKWKAEKIKDENKRQRKSYEYKMWRKAVYERDNYTCVFCNARGGNGKSVELNPDHIKPFSLFPELRFDVNNGRTLCRECHKKTDTFGWKIQKKVREAKLTKQIIV